MGCNMHPNCPYCAKRSDYVSDFRTTVRFGSFHRTSDSKDVQRFLCKHCKKTFSKATMDPRYRQKKRQKNNLLEELLASAVSQRRSARILRINRKTVARRLRFLGNAAREELFMETASSKVEHMQFDDLETFEHTKYKPVAITLAVEGKTRRILGFRVAQMAAKGIIAERSIKKYGFRVDERAEKRRALFTELAPIINPGAIIKSDSNPHYVEDVKEFFPTCVHETCIGERGAITGQGELKKTSFDPIFSLNHTCAMARANMCRLIRKTWCTTKNRHRLDDHLAIFAAYHNRQLKREAGRRLRFKQALAS